MAETVSGFLRNLANLPIGAKQPVLIFAARDASASGQTLFITDPIRVIPDETTGAFTVALTASESTTPPTVYDVSAEWLDPNAFVAGSGMSRRDILSGLSVPLGGGTMGDILANQGGTSWWWIETNDAIDPPGSTPGDFVLNPDTDDVTIIF